MRNSPLIYLDEGCTKWIFFSTDMITDNYLTLMAVTDKIVLTCPKCTPELKKSYSSVGNNVLFDIPLL